ncbi:MAG: sigma-70 family RNA polymerase sigma factor [Flavobacteriales bacterium]|nr:sigma-70 family RNA polymerase sigma factor [Flavobacteriales bacterium]
MKIDPAHSVQTRQAFSIWVEEKYAVVYHTVVRMVLCKEDAQDIVQIVFIKAWQGIEKFEGHEKQLHAWLMRIAHNAAIDALRKRKVRRTVSLDTQMEQRVESLESDPFFDGDAALAHLHAALETLPDKQRLVFNYRYFDNLPYAEIAEITGTSIGALKASYHFAKSKVEAYVLNHSA